MIKIKFIKTVSDVRCKPKQSKISIPQSHHQEGAVLIVVLLLLVLISLAGLMAVRQSSTDLKLATSDQVNTLLLQSSDSANQQLESIINGDATSREYQDILSSSGMFGHFILDADNSTDEYIYCYNSESGKYLLSKATVKQLSTAFPNSNGICDFEDAKGYTSSRQTVVTQMSVTKTPTDGKEPPLSHNIEGEEVPSDSSIKHLFDVRSTSAIPSYSKNKPTDCFQNTVIDANKGTGQTISECLASKNTPSKMISEQVELENVTYTIECLELGDDDTLNSACSKAGGNSSGSGTSTSSSVGAGTASGTGN